MNYKKMLVAVDQTEEAEEVIAAALNAASDDCEVHLITVVTPLANSYGQMVWLPLLGDSSEIEESFAKQSRARLTKLALKYELSTNHIHAEIGSPATVIRAKADAIAADLIVVGTHGRHGISLILGSTANAVLHGVAQNVLVVRLSTD